MRSVIFGAFMALTVTAATAAEDLNSANYMLPACKEWLTDRGSGFRGGRCVGTVKTVGFMAMNSDVGIRALSGEGQLMAIERKWRCADIPYGVTTEQTVRVVVRYIEARPHRMHEPFHSLALEALLDAWPCRN